MNKENKHGWPHGIVEKEWDLDKKGEDLSLTEL